MDKLWARIPPEKIPSSTRVDGKFWSYFKKGDRILEVGCGLGRFLYSCSTRGLSPIGIDINKEAIEKLSKDAYLFGAEVYCADILKAKFKKKFKGALLQGLLCSLKKNDRAKCLKKVRSIMEKGGHLHIAEFEMSEKFEDRYKEDSKITGEYGTLSVKDKDTGKELCRSHNFYAQEIKDLIKQAGFKIISFKKTLFTSYHGDKKPGLMIIAQSPE
ncbi:MAG: methyltransferase domain-containing protein [Candidatus Staskawiczbacteria bacterium]|nr:methyltransferase domain-containing protein [Candidatus Staskawiczbacteria bacterium]